MGKTLYITDLDGTLLNSEGLVSSTSVAMLNEAISAGALFSVATARTPSTVESLMGDVDARIPFIVMTGAAMWNPLTRKFSNPVTISEATSGEILSILRAHSLPSFVYRLQGDKINIYHTGRLSDLERHFISDRTGSAYKVFHIPEDGNSEIPEPLTDVALFYAMQPSAQVEAAYNEIKEKVECNPIFYHDMFGKETGIMEVFSPLVSKAAALRRLKSIVGADRVVAFGDNLNDIPMLRAADVAVAVENAVDEVKGVADMTIGPNTADSVARFILEDVRSGGAASDGLTPESGKTN